MTEPGKGRTSGATNALSAAHGLFEGPGEMRALCRAHEWSATPFGPPRNWPVSLRVTVATMLASRHPMFLWWGPELAQIYNDAYRPSFGEDGRHLRALGARGKDFWTEIWDIIGPQIEQIMAGGDATWHEDQLVPIERNGRIENVWWTYGYSPAFDDDGQVNGVLVVCQETTQRVLDATERERLLHALDVERQRLAVVFQEAPAFLAVLRGPEHTFALANEAYYQLIGARDIVGKALLDALPEVRGQGFVELLDDVVATGVPFIGREVSVFLTRTPGASPEERFVDFNYMPLVEADGTRVGVIAHGTDVTEQVTARREIERLYVLEREARGAVEEAYRAAESANRAKGEFLAVMSHELRTPLNAIGGYAELLEMGIRGPVTPDQREDLHRIQTSQRHLLGLINEVLNYAKLETGSVQYAIEDVPVREVLNAAELLVSPQARAKKLVLVVADCPPALCVRADAEKLRQVIVNLLSNAVKFTDAGGRIEVIVTGGESHVSITVRDTGVGIPDGKLGAIFDPFVQVRSDLTRPHEGTGLGLAISRDLALGMNGNLTVESELGAGSAFTLTLPVSA